MRNKLLILFGMVIIIIGCTIMLYDVTLREYQSRVEEKNVIDFFEKYDVSSSEKDTNNEYIIEKQDETVIEQIYEEYDDSIAVLEIPKIKLKRTIYDIYSIKNNVNKNISLLKESVLPGLETVSHIFLAAHAGNSYISYFKNLYLLSLNDDIYFYFQNKKYIYKVVDIYEIAKENKSFIKQTAMQDISLITCISGTNKRLIVLAKLEKII